MQPRDSCSGKFSDICVRWLNTIAASVAVLMCALPGSAQTPVVNPRTATFEPSPDHNAVGQSGVPLVELYQLDLYLVGASAPFQSIGLGKPNPDATGTIVIDLTTIFAGWPVPGTNYFATVAAVGAGGSSSSAASNTFTFATATPPPPPPSSCGFDVYPRSLTVGSGASAQSTAVTTASTCTWSVTSNAGWINVTGSATRTGPVLATFSVAANTGAPRTGTLTVAGQAVTISQGGGASVAPVAPTNFRMSPSP